MKKAWLFLPLLIVMLLCACTALAADYEYIVDEQGNATISRYTGKAENIEIPSEIDGHCVTGIGNAAFAYHSNIISISIPDSVTAIGTNPFIQCKNLEKIMVANDHPALAAIDGVLFHKPSKTLVSYPAAKSDDAYQIPQGIVSISPHSPTIRTSLPFPTA